MSSTSAIVWLRRDLRLADNPALHEALANHGRVCVLFIDETGGDAPRRRGGASRWWLHHSLKSLAASLEGIGGRLVVERGRAADIVPALAGRCGAAAVYWNRRYDGPGVAVDTALKAALERHGVDARSFNASLLFEPWEVKTGDGKPYRVFTPFWRAARGFGDPARPLAAPRAIEPAGSEGFGVDLATLDLLPAKPDWAGGIREAWEAGEKAAMARLHEFLDHGLKGYAGGRDRPDKASTSRLSPHLAFGEISPRQIWHATRHAVDSGRAPARDGEKFLAELGWREFSWHLLFHHPALAAENFNAAFDAFEWRGGDELFEAWKRGRTGYPVVDAGMRQLWQTGWMHNRVRMVAASFLIKHCLIDWRRGEQWFWDTLVDADLANNAASWQWVAGSGADAAPYFRIFNPVLQGEKFDPRGDYVRRWVPEIAGLPDALVHKPWEAGAEALEKAGIKLGEDYPEPVVDHAAARKRALAAYGPVKAHGSPS